MNLVVAPKSSSDDKNFNNLVLIIEDDMELLESLKDLLILSGFRTATATDGQSGLDLARTINPGCLLVDLKLPDIDGYAVLRQLKKNAQTAAIPVLILSGYVRAEDQELALELGAMAYITKPYNIAQLVKTIRQALQQR